MEISNEKTYMHGCTVYKFRFGEPGAYKQSLTVNYSPTGNCQVASIRTFYSIVSIRNKENRIKLLNTIFKTICKNIFLFDIKEENYKKLIELFEEDDIIMNNTYTSTNNSRMRIVLVKTTNFTKRHK